MDVLDETPAPQHPPVPAAILPTPERLITGPQLLSALALAALGVVTVALAIGFVAVIVWLF